MWSILACSNFLAQTLYRSEVVFKCERASTRLLHFSFDWITFKTCYFCMGLCSGAHRKQRCLSSPGAGGLNYMALILGSDLLWVKQQVLLATAISLAQLIGCFILSFSTFYLKEAHVMALVWAARLSIPFPLSKTELGLPGMMARTVTHWVISTAHWVANLLIKGLSK